MAGKVLKKAVLTAAKYILLALFFIYGVSVFLAAGFLT